MYNIYYNPEKFGLKVVAEIDYSSGCYQFDLRIVWEDNNGNLLTARDSGCSWPQQFESVGLNDLEKVSYKNLEDESKGKEFSGGVDFLEKVRKAIGRKKGYK